MDKFNWWWGQEYIEKVFAISLWKHNNINRNIPTPPNFIIFKLKGVQSQWLITSYSLSFFHLFFLQMTTKLEHLMRFSAQLIAERKCICQSKWLNYGRKLRCQCFQVCHLNFLSIFIECFVPKEKEIMEF